MNLLLLQVICLPAGPNVQRLHSSRYCAFSLSFSYSFSIIQSMSFCLDLPLPLFPPIRSSIISHCGELPLRMCSICLVLIISNKDFFFHIFQNFFIRAAFCPADPLQPPLYPHLKSLYPFEVLLSHSTRLRSVQRDAPYLCLTIPFLVSLFSPPFNNSYLLVNASFPIAILFLISLWHFASSDIRLPR